MHLMSEADSARFVAALDKVDTALTAIRMEFEDLARQSADKLASLRARERSGEVCQPSTEHREPVTA